jgi:hypothetical protein
MAPNRLLMLCNAPLAFIVHSAQLSQFLALQATIPKHSITFSVETAPLDPTVHTTQTQVQFQEMGI